MSMILILHFLGHGLKAADNIPLIYYLLKSFVFNGVNIFFLISGFFSIKYSTRGLIKLAITVGLFGCVNYAGLICVGENVSVKNLLYMILYPISMSPYWFMRVYLFLFVSAPIITSGLNALTKVQLRNTLIILVLLVVYVRCGLASYTYLQAFYLYCVGYYIRHYGFLPRVSAGKWFGIFVLSCVLFSILYTFGKYKGINVDWLFDSYQNIFTVVGSIALCMCFSKLRFTSKSVNKIASASLGCYLLQDGYFGFRYFYEWQTNFLLENGLGMKLVGMLALCFVGYWILSYLLTSFMNLWISPFSAWIESLGLRVFHKVCRKL